MNRFSYLNVKLLEGLWVFLEMGGVRGIREDKY